MCPGLVSSSLNTQPLQLDVQLRQQLELVYQIIVLIELTGSISSTLSFPHVYCCVPVHIYLKTLTKDFLNFLNSFSLVCLSSFLCYPVFTLSVRCACLHFIMMTMLLFWYVYSWVLIPLLVVLRKEFPHRQIPQWRIHKNRLFTPTSRYNALSTSSVCFDEIEYSFKNCAPTYT